MNNGAESPMPPLTAASQQASDCIDSFLMKAAGEGIWGAPTPPATLNDGVDRFLYGLRVTGAWQCPDVPPYADNADTLSDDDDDDSSTSGDSDDVGDTSPRLTALAERARQSMSLTDQMSWIHDEARTPISAVGGLGGAEFPSGRKLNGISSPSSTMFPGGTSPAALGGSFGALSGGDASPQMPATKTPAGAVTVGSGFAYLDDIVSAAARHPPSAVQKQEVPLTKRQRKAFRKQQQEERQVELLRQQIQKRQLQEEKAQKQQQPPKATGGSIPPPPVPKLGALATSSTAKGAVPPPPAHSALRGPNSANASPPPPPVKGNGIPPPPASLGTTPLAGASAASGGKMPPSAPIIPGPPLPVKKAKQQQGKRVLQATPPPPPAVVAPHPSAGDAALRAAIQNSAAPPAANRAGAPGVLLPPTQGLLPPPPTAHPQPHGIQPVLKANRTEASRIATQQQPPAYSGITPMVGAAVHPPPPPIAPNHTKAVVHPPTMASGKMPPRIVGPPVGISRVAGGARGLMPPPPVPGKAAGLLRGKMPVPMPPVKGLMGKSSIPPPPMPGLGGRFVTPAKAPPGYHMASKGKLPLQPVSISKLPGKRPLAPAVAARGNRAQLRQLNEPGSVHLPIGGPNPDLPKRATLCMDTSALLELDRESLDWLIKNNKVIIPAKVLQEVDKHKDFSRGDKHNLKMAAKAACDVLLANFDQGNCVLQANSDHDAEYERKLGADASPDDFIVACAVFFAKIERDNFGGTLYLLTNDRMMKLKAQGERLPVLNLTEATAWSSFKASVDRSTAKHGV